MSLYIIFGIIIALFLIIALILLLPVGLGIKYENGAFIIVQISFLKFDISFKRIAEKSKRKIEEKKETKEESELEKQIDKSIMDIDFIISLFGDFRRFVRKRFTLKEFEMNVRLGTADAASTAVLTGMLYSLAYNLLGLLDKLIQVKKPKVNVKPEFNDLTFQLTLYGIIKARLVHIIATAIVFAYKLFKYKRKNKEEIK